MQGPPPSACKWCGGNHWEQLCPAMQQQQAQMGQGLQRAPQGHGFMGNHQAVNMAMAKQQWPWGPQLMNAGQQQMANPMQTQTSLGVGGGITSDHILKQYLQAVYRELGIRVQNPQGHTGVSQTAGLRIITVQELRIVTTIFTPAHPDDPTRQVHTPDSAPEGRRPERRRPPNTRHRNRLRQHQATPATPAARKDPKTAPKKGRGT